MVITTGFRLKTKDMNERIRMKRIFGLSLIALCSLGVMGCSSEVSAPPGLPPLPAETPEQAAKETDPFLKKLVAIPLDKRKAYVEAHSEEMREFIKRALGQPVIVN